MNFTLFMSMMGIYLKEYFPEELDLSLKPTDLSGCTTCRSMTYDFIIVGAGTAGCVLANRLSENPNWNVLLIEAGGDENYITDIPALGGLFTGTKFDWNYTTVKQEAVCQDNDGYCKFPLGHVMGGSSTIGDMKYMRGNPTDYDEWADLGNSGWSYKDILPYFYKSENITLNESDIPDVAYHNPKGLIKVSHKNSSIFQSYFEIAGAAGFTLIDFDGQYKVSMGYRLTTEGGMRKSVSKSYLNPIRNRKNMHIFKNTIVTKILFSNEDQKTAVGVACVMEGQEYELHSSKEVILSAGAINTPKLLMLSGIGPKKHLEELFIPVVADLPVGENLADHPGIIYRFFTNTTELIYDENSLKEAMLEYAKYREGVLSVPQWTVIGLDNIMPKGEDRTELTAFHFGGYSITDLLFNDKLKFLKIFNTDRLLVSHSRGTVKLKSKNYNDPPLIDPKYLSDKRDLKHLTAIALDAFNFFNAPGWAKHNISLIPSKCKYDDTFSEKFLHCFIKHNSHLGIYPMGTAKMGPISDKTAVVDPNLKVHGVDNLRVVDASVIPKPIRGLPMATVDMIAEKASVLIRSNY